MPNISMYDKTHYKKKKKKKLKKKIHAKDSIKKLLELINMFRKVTDYKINTQSLLQFCSLAMEYQKDK